MQFTRKSPNLYLMVLGLLLITIILGMEAQAQTPVPNATPQVSVPARPEYTINRTISTDNLLPGQEANVTLTLEHQGSDDDFTYVERLPRGLEIVNTDAAGTATYSNIEWQGNSSNTSTYTFSYTVRLGCDAPPLLVWQGEINSPVAGRVTSPSAVINRQNLTIANKTNKIYVERQEELQLMLTNPTDQAITVSLAAETNNNFIQVNGINTLATTIEANSSEIANLNVVGLQTGTARLELTPNINNIPSCPLALPVIVEAEPNLPEVSVSTTLDILVSSKGVNDIQALAVVIPLPDGVDIIEDSFYRIDENNQAHRLDLPLFDEYSFTKTLDENIKKEENETISYPRTAVFIIKEDIGTDQFLRFDVQSAGRFSFDPSLTSLVGLTPEPFLIKGQKNAVERYLKAEKANSFVTAQPTTNIKFIGDDAGILSPAQGTTIRSGDVTMIQVDVPLEAAKSNAVSLYITAENGVRERVSDEQIGQLANNPETQRQIRDYIAVKLNPGDNLISLEVTGAEGKLVRDNRTVTIAGPATKIAIEPLSTLVADSAEPLRFRLTLLDAYGNVPTDGLVTLEFNGAEPLTPDFEPQQLGYQMRHTQGSAILEVKPVIDPRTLTIKASFEPTISGTIETPIYEDYFTIGSNLRPWIVNGVGSIGINISEKFKIDAGASVFARGHLGNDYLLTFAVNYPLDPLGRFGDPYEPFPVPGSSNVLSEDAESRDGFFVRLERDLSYIQYGEFKTNITGSLIGLSRAYTGISGQYRSNDDIAKNGIFAQAYGAYIPTAQRVTDLEIAGDGTTLYVLPGAPIVKGSLSVEIIKRNAFDPNLPEDESNRLIQDGDPLVSRLIELNDYTIDEDIGFVRLSRPLPVIDQEGNRYFLRASYRTEASDSNKAWQAGGSIGYDYVLPRAEEDTENNAGETRLNAKIGGYLEQTETRDVTVLGGAAQLNREDASTSTNVTADLEIAYGSERLSTNSDEKQNTSGLGVATGIKYQSPLINGNLRYQYLNDSFRSAKVSSKEATGHSLDTQIEWAILRYIGVGLEARIKNHPKKDSGRNTDYDAYAYGIYKDNGRLNIAKNLEAEAGIGVKNGVPKLRFGIDLDELYLIDTLSLELTHIQSLSGADDKDAHSVTNLTIGYEIIENLSLELTDRYTWGIDNALLIGLVSRFDNGRLFGSTANFGSTQLSARYELPRGLNQSAGSVRLGASTSYPIDEKLSIEASFDQVIKLSDDDIISNVQEDATILAAALHYDDKDFDGQLRYEVRLGDSTKHVANLGFNIALTNTLFVSGTADFVADEKRTPDTGLRISLAGAYRSSLFDILANNNLKMGAYEKDGDTILEGDWRLTFPINTLIGIDPRLAIYAGYAYAYHEAGETSKNPSKGYRDTISIGANIEPWSGGSLAAYGRLYHDWKNEQTALGFTLEASQRINCGSYGVLAYSFDEIPDPVFSQDGLQARLDVLVDEQWRCGGGDIIGQVFIDDDGDGVNQNAIAEKDTPDIIQENPHKEAIHNLTIRLYNLENTLIATTYSDEDGNYSFENVYVDYDYVIRVNPPTDYVFSPLQIEDNSKYDSDIDPETYTSPIFRVGRFQDVRNLDIGLVPTAQTSRETQP